LVEHVQKKEKKCIAVEPEERVEKNRRSRERKKSNGRIRCPWIKKKEKSFGTAERCCCKKRMITIERCLQTTKESIRGEEKKEKKK